MRAKKRILIAIVIAITALFITNKYWLIVRPISVNFDIKGKGVLNIEAQLNDNFKKTKINSATINLDESSQVNIDVKRAKHPKGLSLALSAKTTPTPLQISNIEIRNGKYKLDDIEKFKADGANILIKDNKLILTPNENEITLTYPDILNVKAGISFKFFIFSIILILVYLFAYKLSDYIADFKTVKGKSRIEIIFLCIFFTFLFIPMMHINKENISERENRRLAKWKPLISIDNEINYSFGKDFNEWFNDRFFLRDELISANYFKFLLTKYWMTKDVIKGKDGWLFGGWESSIESYTNKRLFDNDELEKITDYLREANEHCKQNGKKFYFLIAPDKSKIYEEFYTDRIIKISDKSKTDQLIEYINKNSDIKVIYPKEKLISLKGKELLYWKDDTHWNKLGAYYGYLELMNAIQRDFKFIKIYKPYKTIIEKHTDGDLYRITPKLLKEADDTQYTVPKISDDDICNKAKKSRNNIICSNKNGRYNLISYRDSFSTSLIPFLSHTFKDSNFFWRYNISKEEIKDADIAILEIVERYLPTLTDIQME